MIRPRGLRRGGAQMVNGPLGHNLATLVPAIEGQTLVGNLIDWANLHPDKSFKDFAAEQPAAMGDALIQAATMSVATVGAAHAASC